MKSRSSKTALVRSLQQSPFPVYVLSANREILFCNQALCEWIEQSESELLGQKCSYHPGPNGESSVSPTTGLCPPPPVLTGVQSEGFVYRACENRLQYRDAVFVPLEEGLDTSVLAIVHGQPRSEAIARRRDVSLSPVELHLAVQQMHVESTRRIDIDVVIGSSGAASRIRKQIDVAIDSNVNVTISGPIGSGRRQIAKWIHYGRGIEQAGPLIPIDGILCDAEIVQSTIKDLYRHLKDYPDEPLGRLLITDVDRMVLSAQNELIGFLELPDFQLPVMATASELATDVENKSAFEARLVPELWYRLSTISIQIPSLTDRRQDIPFLVQTLLEHSNVDQKRQLAGFDPAAMELLCSYWWPGQLAELSQTIESACRSAQGSLITIADLPKHMRLAMRAQLTPSSHETKLDLDQVLAEVETELIHRAVKQAGGNKSKAAELLSISRARLLRRWESMPDSRGTESE